MDKDKVLFLQLIACIFGNVWTDCGQTKFNHSKGVIHSPDHFINSTCTYEIDVSSESRWVRLNWDKFVMDATMPYCLDGDHVEVYIGCNSSKTSVSRFCTGNMKTLPHTIYAIDGCITIEFRSSRGLTSNFFSASYETFTIDTSSQYSTGCSRFSKLKRYSGTILSPLWPKPYSLYRFPYSNDCEWEIEAGSNKVIKLNFMHFDIYNTDSTGVCYNDKVIVKGKKSDKTSEKEKWGFCGRKPPFSITTAYYEVDVEMKLSSYTKSYASRGFVVGFVAYSDDQVDTTIAVKWQYIFGIIIVLVVILIIGVFCYCLYKKRQAASSQAVNQGFVPIPNNYPKSNTYPQQYVYPQPQVYPNQTAYSQQQLYSQQQYQSGYPSQYPGAQEINQPNMYPYNHPNQGFREPRPPPPYQSGSQQLPYQPPQ
ncbi:bone morphogenetic protein 1 [Hydra vulgaris]|uniref:Bone morphogenetic protein 1 n=1 Tax=Hydra vulgaris TaxID=6087 RepID=A0ABM4D7X0_HYDVU